MLKVGLTGSIAVGKSFVRGVFRDLGCHVLDADKTAREVVEPGTDGLRQIVREFGTSVLRPDGELDRNKLGAIVFADEQKRKLLNSIVHPLVIASQDRWIKMTAENDPRGIAIIDAALMIESGGYKRFDKLIVVFCERETQIERLMTRNQITRADAERRIAAQMTSSEKRQYADYEIDTTGSMAETRERVRQVYNTLLTLLPTTA